MSRDKATPGNGLLLFFRVDDFDMALKRARAPVARLEEGPHANPNTRTREFSLRDPDGYYVTISSFTSIEVGGHKPPAYRYTHTIMQSHRKTLPTPPCDVMLRCSARGRAHALRV